MRAVFDVLVVGVAPGCRFVVTGLEFSLSEDIPSVGRSVSSSGSSGRSDAVGLGGGRVWKSVCGGEEVWRWWDVEAAEGEGW